MPELAEVEFYRRRWHEAAQGRTIRRVRLHPRARIFREASPSRLQRLLTGSRLRDSAAAAKQMLLHFDPGLWLGVHLGMSGELRVEPGSFTPGLHDHLVLQTDGPALVLRDPRMFGRVRLHQGNRPPDWWTSIAPAILSPAFSTGSVAAFLRRHARSPIKSVLLLQEQFPGIGNWMADEILWRAALHPRRCAGDLRPNEIARLRRECRNVCRLALRRIAGHGGRLPPDLNVGIPYTWLFHHRWESGGTCPRTRKPLAHATIGGRNTCWSPARQKLPRRT